VVGNIKARGDGGKSPDGPDQKMLLPPFETDLKRKQEIPAKNRKL
jgi:hypothetical protein